MNTYPLAGILIAMKLNLEKKVALITGASKGIGYAIAKTLASYGMSVVIAARTESALSALAESIAASGGNAIAFATDLMHADSATNLVDAAMNKFQRIDLIVNNAGATKRGDFLTLSDQDWRDGFELKFHGAVRLCRAAWPHLIQSRGGIINIAGIGGRTGNREFTLGGSVNAAMMLFTKALADRGVYDGVRVNAINPGAIATERLTRRISTLAAEQNIDYEKASDMLAAKERIAKFGLPDDIANAVAFLASDQSSYLQGGVIDIDGGATRTL